MNKVTSFLMVMIVVLSLSVSPLVSVQARDTSGLASVVKGAGREIYNQYIVVLKPTTTATDQAKLIDSLVRENIRVIRTYTAVFRGFTVILTDSALAKMRANPLVQYIQHDYIVNVYAGNPEIEESQFSEDQGAQLDAASSVQLSPGWGLDRIDQRNLPLDGTYNYQSVGAGVHIYIIDSGIRSSHVEFLGRATQELDIVKDGKDGCLGRGTMIAGTAAGTTYGPAKGAQIHAVRVIGCVRETTLSAYIMGLDWVGLNHKHPAVATTGFLIEKDTVVDLAVNGLIKHGITFVSPAYSSSSNSCYYSPSNLPAVLTVSSSDSADDREYLVSGLPTCVKLIAPGASVRTALASSDTASTISARDNGVAAGFVAGVAALYLQWNPSASPEQVRKALLEAATPDVLADKGDPNLLLYSQVGTQPVAPTLISPDGYSLDASPSFRWTHIPGASSYEFQLYAGVNLIESKTIEVSACSGFTCTYSPTTSLTIPGNFSWKVRAMIAETWQVFSIRKSFSVVKPVMAPVSPSGFIGDTEPVFIWNNISSATQYEFKLYKESALYDFRTIYSNECVATTCSYKRIVSLPLAKYSWYVRAKIGGEWTPFSSVQRFSVSTLVPVPQRPDGVIFDTMPKLTWKSVSNATQYEYRVFKGTILKENRIIDSTTCDDASCVCTDSDCHAKMMRYMPYGLFNWDIRAKVNGVWRAWSTKRNFTIYAPFGFTRDFSETSWELQNGKATVDRTGGLDLYGIREKVQTMVHVNNYSSNFTFETLVASDCNDCDLMLLFHAQPQPLTEYGDLNNGYELSIRMDGWYYFGVQKKGQWYWIIPWTRIGNLDDLRNRLKVTVNGTYVELFINRTRVAYGNLSDFKQGQVGSGFYLTPNPFHKQLEVMEANLTMGAPTAATSLNQGGVNLDELQPYLDSSMDRTHMPIP